MTLDEAIAKLRELNEPVPTPMRLPTAAEVAAAERTIGRALHPDLRHYLLKASDVVFSDKEPATIVVSDSSSDLVSMCEEAWEEYELPKKLLPFCEDNGDYYCMNAKGEVVFWSPDGVSNDKWANLAAWIEEVWIGEAE